MNEWELRLVRYHRKSRYFRVNLPRPVQEALDPGLYGEIRLVGPMKYKGGVAFALLPPSIDHSGEDF